MDERGNLPRGSASKLEAGLRHNGANSRLHVDCITYAVEDKSIPAWCLNGWEVS